MPAQALCILLTTFFSLYTMIMFALCSLYGKTAIGLRKDTGSPFSIFFYGMLTTTSFEDMAGSFSPTGSGLTPCRSTAPFNSSCAEP